MNTETHCIVCGREECPVKVEPMRWGADDFEVLEQFVQRNSWEECAQLLENFKN